MGPYGEDLLLLPGDVTNGWYHYTGMITGSGTLCFELKDFGDSFYSTAWVDNVKLTENVNPVPESSTFLLLGTSLIGLLAAKISSKRSRQN
jgi:hypothetical protein